MGEFSPQTSAPNQPVWVKASNGTDRVFDHVFFATGRSPNTDGIGLEEVGVKLNRRGAIEVDAGNGIDFQREFVVVGDRNTPMSVGLALVPALFGFWLLLSRRLRSKRAVFS